MDTTAAPASAPNPEEPQVTLDEEECAGLEEARRAWANVPKVSFPADKGFIDPDLDAIRTRGLRPGDTYVRMPRLKRQGFEKIEPGRLGATERAEEPASTTGRFLRDLRTALLGRTMATHELMHERLTKVKALAVLSSDALSSVAYATEQILVVLVSAGAAAYSLTLPITGAILLLLFAVVASYRQTIRAYPQGGGSYIVAKDNLGPIAGLVAASALMTDYVLTVAVSVASGVDNIVSAAPALGPHRILVCISLIVLIVVGNLRGLRESGSIFAAPTYLFIGSIFLTFAVCIAKVLLGQLPAANPHLPNPTQPLVLLLILRAFASGCTALTGVEAISDGVPAFKKPEWRNARTTLTIMGTLLGAMFLGISVLTVHLGLVALDPSSPHYQTIISQLAHEAYGGGGSILYYLVTATTTAILILAANTSFSDFPRLFYFLARDDYAPHQFKRLGDRLTYSNGIIVLATLASLLIVFFNARTESLIPLYAVGVFLAFTMSQAGMVTRWLRRRERGWKKGLMLNSIGMTMTALVLLITSSAKFLEGAWIIVIIIPTLVALFLAVHRHYAEVSTQITPEIPTSPSELKTICVVPLADLNVVALQSLAMARAISDQVFAIHLTDDPEGIAKLKA
ncbi:MAG TPA: APC family permease, partial [Candidatus Sulfotelmatobacter sp.]|nr:APC family permease [Candidatus Sulfotelmatobacter sp.]